MGSVSFSGRCGQCRQALAPMVWGRAPCMTATNVPPGRCGSSDEAPGLAMQRGRRTKARALDCMQTRPSTCVAAFASWWASARGKQGCCNRRAVRTALLDDAPTPEPAMRAALDLDGRHAAHEGPRVLAGLRVGRRHRQQLARCRQPFGLGRRCEQPVVADALEAPGPRRGPFVAHAAHAAAAGR